MPVNASPKTENIFLSIEVLMSNNDPKGKPHRSRQGPMD